MCTVYFWCESDKSRARSFSVVVFVTEWNMAFEMDLLVVFVVAVVVRAVFSLSHPLNSKLSLHEHVYAIG